MREKIILFLLLVLFLNCKNKNDFSVFSLKEEPLLVAENVYEINKSKIKFELLTDTTYNFVAIEKNFNYEKTEKYSGLCKVVNDTIFFKPFEFEYTNSEKAVIKNGFLEFICAQTIFRVELKNNFLKTYNNLDFSKYQDYAIFTYKPENDNSDFLPYDISQTELIEIDRILENCFLENSKLLRKKNNYVKQCRAVINRNKEIEIWVKYYCKNNYDKNWFRYQEILMKDGGNCNISIKINLTKRNYSNLLLAGQA